MERDGYSISLWQSAIKSFSSHARLSNQNLFDVVIVGGGMTGLSTALALQSEGKTCVLIEAHEIGFGTTSGTTAHINTLLEKAYHDIEKDFSGEVAARVAKAVGDSIALIRKNITDFGIDCDFSMEPGYIFSADEKQTGILNAMVDSCRKFGVEAEFINGDQFPMPFHRVALFANQAQFHPMKYTLGLAREFEKRGGIILQNCRMTKLEKNTHLMVFTTQGEIHTRQVVYATHTPPGVNVLHTLIAPYRSYVLSVELESDSYPQGLLYDLEEPYHYLRLQRENGHTYLMIGGADHKTGSQDNTAVPYRELEAFARKHFPVRRIAYQWSSQYYESADGLAYIGVLPGDTEQIFVATGFGGNGMIYSHISALLLSDLIINGKSNYADIFTPKRIKPAASFSKFIKENAQVVKELITGIMPREKLEAVVDLATDEGRVVEYDGKKTGVYKDLSGNLFAINPVCPHMKCLVVWNNTEKSWDCPCHGSRFSFTGELLTGPAKHDLEQYQLSEGG